MIFVRATDGSLRDFNAAASQGEGHIQDFARQIAATLEDGNPQLNSVLMTLSLVLSREWGNGLLGLLQGTLRGYHGDPFPHSLLRTRELVLPDNPKTTSKLGLLDEENAICIALRFCVSLPLAWLYEPREPQYPLIKEHTLSYRGP